MKPDATQVFLYAIARTANGVVELERFLIAHPHNAPETDPTGETHVLRLSSAKGHSAVAAINAMLASIAALAPHSRFWGLVDATVTFPSLKPKTPPAKPVKRPFLSRTRIVVRQRRTTESVE